MKIMEMCALLEIPVEVQELISNCEINWNDFNLKKEIAQMKDPKCWEGVVERLNTLLTPDEDGIKILTCQLQCVCEIYDEYEKLDISQKIFIDTMKFFTRFLIDYKNKNGCYRYVWAWWAVRQISMMEFRIGELEYEMRVENSQNVIDIHIPGDADLSVTKLNDSYHEACAFFAKYYPEFKGVDMVCSSWLLAPSLKEVLPEDSRIMQFQNSFTILSVEEDSPGFMDWIYGGRDIPINELPEETTLQRRLKPHLLNGGKIEWATGKLRYSY